MRVDVLLDSGVLVSRVKTPSLNRFIIKHPGIPEERYDNPGRNTVPEAVLSVTGLRKVDLDGTDVSLNLASQQEGLFLLTDSGPSIQRKLSQLTYTNELDTAGVVARRNKEQNQKREKQLREQIDEWEVQKAALSWVDAASDELETITTLISNRNTLVAQLEKLSAISDWRDSWRVRMQVAIKQDEALAKVDLQSIEVDMDKAEELMRLRAELGRLHSWSEGHQKRTFLLSEQERDVLAKIEALTGELSKVDVCPLCGRSWN
jgi:hypothetical protein